jgi:hypothetical protein
MRMRTIVQGALLLSLALAPACGGGGAETEGAKSSGGPTPSTSDGGAAPESSAAATTTTVALADGGDLQGAKLNETRTVASTSASASPAPKGPHKHDAGRGPDDIRAIIMARRDDARACYDNALKDHPGIEGDLVIQWTIDPKGNVTQVSLDTSRSQIVEPTVVACVSDIIKNVQFAPSQGGFETKAFYPFNFHPHHGGQQRSP